MSEENEKKILTREEFEARVEASYKVDRQKAVDAIFGLYLEYRESDRWIQAAAANKILQTHFGEMLDKPDDIYDRYKYRMESKE